MLNHNIFITAEPTLVRHRIVRPQCLLIDRYNGIVDCYANSRPL